MLLCRDRCYVDRFYERGEIVDKAGSHFSEIVVKGQLPKGNLCTEGEQPSALIADSGTGPSDTYQALYVTAGKEYFTVRASGIGKAHKASLTQLSAALARSLFDKLGRRCRYHFTLEDTQSALHKANEFDLQQRRDREAREQYEDEHRNDAYEWFQKPGEGIHL